MHLFLSFQTCTFLWACIHTALWLQSIKAYVIFKSCDIYHFRQLPRLFLPDLTETHFPKNSETHFRKLENWNLKDNYCFYKFSHAKIWKFLQTVKNSVQNVKFPIKDIKTHIQNAWNAFPKVQNSCPKGKNSFPQDFARVDLSRIWAKKALFASADICTCNIFQYLQHYQCLLMWC